MKNTAYPGIKPESMAYISKEKDVTIEQVPDVDRMAFRDVFRVMNTVQLQQINSQVTNYLKDIAIEELKFRGLLN